MSYYWENTIWQSKDGSWNHGYYKRISSENSPALWEDPEAGYDPEWDDTFDDSEFAAVATGFRTFEAADDFQPYGNPGTYVELPYKGNSRACKELDLMAQLHKDPEAKAKHDRKVHNRKRREHFAELEKKWESEDFTKCAVSVTIGGDDRVYDYTGLNTTVTGLMKTEGDWLTVDGKKVRNLKTGKFHNRVKNIEISLVVRRAW